MVAATVLAAPLITDAHAINSEFGGGASISASSSGGNSWGSDREQRMANGPISKKTRCKSNAYDRKVAQKFCAGKKQLDKPVKQVKCRGQVRRWICT